VNEQAARIPPEARGGAVPVSPPPGMVALPMGKGVVLVLPVRVYLAGLRLGKILRRRRRWRSGRRRPPGIPDSSRIALLTCPAPALYGESWTIGREGP
jgi:hypothetical protein